MLMGRACVPFTQNRGSPLFEGSRGLLGPKPRSRWGARMRAKLFVRAEALDDSSREGRGSVPAGALRQPTGGAACAGPLGRGVEPPTPGGAPMPSARFALRVDLGGPAVLV